MYVHIFICLLVYLLGEREHCQYYSSYFASIICPSANRQVRQSTDSFMLASRGSSRPTLPHRGLNLSNVDNVKS